MTEQEYSNFTNFINTTLNETMTLDDYESVLDSLDVPIPRKNSKEWMYKSLCHNIDLSHSKNNLAFYPNTRSYYCWSECHVSYNLVTLLEKRFKILDEPKSRFQCIKYICNICNIPFDFKSEDKPTKERYNWKYLKKYTRDETFVEEDKILDESTLDSFPQWYSDTWIDDNISIEVMEKYGIRFYPHQQCIVIPCRNISGKLIGIRGRYLDPNVEHKYYPIRLLNGTQFNFLTNNSLYGLWYTKQAISRRKKVVIFESEKSVLQCDTMYGSDNYSCALYGKAMSEQKKLLLLGLGITETILGLDWDFDSIWNEDKTFTEDFLKYMKNVIRIYKYFSSFIKVTLLLSNDKHNRSQSPSDYNKEMFGWTYKNRFMISKDGDNYILAHKNGYKIIVNKESIK